MKVLDSCNYHGWVFLLQLIMMEQGVNAQCSMCPDGTRNLEHPNRVIPFFNLPGDNTSPTCQEVAEAAAVSDPRTVDCSLVQAQAGFCGCAGVEPRNDCSFCPDGSEPPHLDFVTHSGDRCQALSIYSTFMNHGDCTSRRFQSMQGFAYVCGCPNVQPQCSLCPDGSPPPFPDREAVPGSTCAELATIVKGYTAGVCVDAQTTLEIAAARCACPGAEFPVCQVQQNPHLCTHELLDTLLQEQPGTHCECYSFCDGIYHTCHDFPGGLLTPRLCEGVPVSGCNRRNAHGGNNNNNNNSNPSSGASGSLDFLNGTTVHLLVLTAAGVFPLL